MTNPNYFSTVAIPRHTANYNTVENFPNILSFENFLTQQQTLLTTFSESCSGDKRNTNLLSRTRQDLDPTNHLFLSNRNSVQVVGDNVDASLTPGKYFHPNTLNIQNSNLPKNQQYPLLPHQPFPFIQDLQQPLFRNLDHSSNSSIIHHTDVIDCGPIDRDLPQLQEMFEMEKDKGKQNQLQYQQQTNNMNNFSQCDQLNHNLLRQEHISEANADEEKPDQLPHQVKQREPENVLQNQNIKIELHSKSSATKSHRHKNFVTTDHMNSSQELMMITGCANGYDVISLTKTPFKITKFPF